MSWVGPFDRPVPSASKQEQHCQSQPGPWGTALGMAEGHQLHPCSGHLGQEQWEPGSGYSDGNGAADGREQAEVEALSC